MLQFFRALGCNTPLKKLVVDWSIQSDAVGQTLADSLRTNQGLCHLEVRLGFERRELWTDVISSVANHPSLTYIHLLPDEFHLNDTEQELRQRLRISAFIDLLQANERSQEVESPGEDYDDERWDTEVETRLEINTFRKKLRAFCQMTRASDRPPLLSHAMVLVSSKPSLLWLVVQQNQGTVIQNIGELVEESSLESGPLRKRSRLSS